MGRVVELPRLQGLQDRYLSVFGETLPNQEASLPNKLRCFNSITVAVIIHYPFIQNLKKEVEIKSLVKKDSEMMLIPTPVTSDVMLYVENCDELESQKIAPSQELGQRMSMLDIRVAVPIDETVRA